MTNYIQVSKLTNKQKRSVRRRVAAELDTKPPVSQIFKNKKKYNRKSKYPLNTNEDG